MPDLLHLENSAANPVLVAGKLLSPGGRTVVEARSYTPVVGVRVLNQHAKAEEKPAPPAVEPMSEQAAHDLLMKPVAQVTAALPGLTVPDLRLLRELEGRRDSPRKTLLEAVNEALGDGDATD